MFLNNKNESAWTCLEAIEHLNGDDLEEEQDLDNCYYDKQAKKRIINFVLTDNQMCPF